MFKRVLHYFLVSTSLLFSLNIVDAQTVDAVNLRDSIPAIIRNAPEVDTLSLISPDTGLAEQPESDTVQADTASPREQRGFLDTKVDYSSKDSMRIDVVNQKLFLYGEAKVKYGDIDLAADYIEFDMANQEVFAYGRQDTSGVVKGKPNFSQGSEKFESDSMRYNFETSKGIIYGVVTQQGEGFMHSGITKRTEEGHVHVGKGKYTTCNAEHPHFYLNMTQAIVIPDDKIISGPAYLVLEDIPLLPVGLPFSFFPSTASRASGILFPTWGEETNRGFYIRDGGWYQVLGPHADISAQFELYSKGSWGMKTNAKYKKRYKFNGNFEFNYNKNKSVDDPTFPVSTDYRLIWNHRQDAKANPNRTFSASVNYSSSKYAQNNSNSYDDRFNNQKSSNINYTRKWPGTPFNLSLSARALQNSQTERTQLSLPSGSFNAKNVYPFRRKSGGKKKWYDDIGFSYKSKFQNTLEAPDSVLFQAETLEKFNYAFQHDIPFFINIKTGKMITVSPSLSYTGRMYNWYTEKRLESDGLASEPVLVTDTIHQFVYAHAINPSISVSFNPKLYAMYTNTRENPKVIAVRHVITPKASFSYTPDMSSINPNYNYTVDGKEYSHLEYNAFRAPSEIGRSGSVALGLSNNVEMKLRSNNDTLDEPRKVSLLDNLNFSTTYSPFADQFKWGKLSMNGGTRLFKNTLNFRFTGSFDFYDLDSAGVKIDEFLIDNGKGLMRLTNLGVNMDLRLRSKQGKDDDESQVVVDDNIYPDPMNPGYEYVPGYSMGQYVDFSIPWTLNIGYKWSMSKPKFETKISHLVNVHGDFSLTPKWKIGYKTGFDIERKKLVTTSLNVHRDLHCWEMQFTVVPFGNRQNYSFTIRAKSSMLRDLKLDKKRDWYDNF